MMFVALACAFANAQQSGTPDEVKNPFAGDPSAARTGRIVYEQTCSACHGNDAQGGRGPSLATGQFTHGSEDADLFHNIESGIPGTQMPSFSALPTEDVWRIVAYLRSLSAGRTASNEKVNGDPAAGKEIFWGKGGCGQCHEVNERGSIVGPDLSDAGKSAEASLRAVILNPNAQAVRFNRRQLRQSGISVTTRSGDTVVGIRRAEDNFILLMSDMTGNLRRFERTDIAEEHDLQKSLMPDTYGKTLTSSEVQNIVAYLKTLTGRSQAETAKSELPPGVTDESLRNAKNASDNWLTYWGDYQGTHFSQLTQINRENVKQLQARWSVQMPAGPLLEATPIAVDGILYTTYTTNSGQGVYALDARSGLTIWKYERRQKVTNPYQTNPFNRGVAIVGSRLFFGTMDGALVALDARSGRTVWETQVANTMEGYSITAAPLAVKGAVIVGVAGGEFGIRGFLDAYDAATGKQLWRFNTVPGPGEFGSNTWTGDSWKQGSGATWLTGSYDPELNLVYWTVGNPGPDDNADVRQGDNLFTCSVVALDADSGKLKWHYQFTPGDTHDWDANEDVILADAPIDGVPRKLLLQADRNGFYYVLDRTNGKFLFAKAYVKQTWNKGFTSDGRPIVTENFKATPEGTIVAPTGVGGADWQNPSYDAERNTLFVVATMAESAGFRSAPVTYEPGRLYIGGRPFAAPNPEVHSGLLAIDTRTGDMKWQYRNVLGSFAAGDLATASGLVFLASADGNMTALDSDSGKPLWRFQTGATIASAPMSFAVGGKQYVSISAGNVLYTFALPD
jgi:alcohol dehydrogenase (cytochrome c)